MKKSLLFLAMASLAILFVSCTKSDDVVSNTGQLVTSGNWRVTLFTDSGNDETTDFNGYSFTFSSGGVLMAVKNSVTTTGTWSVSSSNKFNINLGPKDNTNKPLGELTDDWRIISSNSTEIRLGDDNASSNEFVTFTKN